MVYGCDQQPVAQPARYVLKCGDAGETLVNLTWSDWGRPTASATGQEVVKDCTPDCASGASVPYPVTVTITGLNSNIYTAMHVSAPLAPSPAEDFVIDLSGPVVVQSH